MANLFLWFKRKIAYLIKVGNKYQLSFMYLQRMFENSAETGVLVGIHGPCIIPVVFSKLDINQVPRRQLDNSRTGSRVHHIVMVTESTTLNYIIDSDFQICFPIVIRQEEQIEGVESIDRC